MTIAHWVNIIERGVPDVSPLLRDIGISAEAKSEGRDF